MNASCNGISYRRIQTKGPKNIVADTLSCLKMTSNMESFDMAYCYGLNSDDLPDNAFLISYTLIDHKQKKDRTLWKWAQTCLYSLKKFHGGGTTVHLLCFKDKIVVPTSLTKAMNSTMVSLSIMSSLH
jgi:hypothetical protein